MPELPEVETVRRGLEQTIVGKTVKTVDIRVRKLFPDNRAVIDDALIGQKIQSIDRRAKLLLIQLSNQWTLAVHLKMTGQLIVIANSNQQTANSNSQSGQNVLAYCRLPIADCPGFVGGHPQKAYEQSLPHQHTHVIITFTDGTALYFNDLRKFGWMRLLRSGQNSKFGIQNSESKTVEQFLDGLALGPEPLGPEFTIKYFRDGLKNRRMLIKTLLLDQSFIAGIGNIYADEALFAAAIKPTRRADSLKKSESTKLYQAIKVVLELGITQGGTSFNSYRNVQGTPGAMRAHLKVYGREGQPCLRCGDNIMRKRIGQRSAHFCPTCQR